MVDISVIIDNWNARELLRRCLVSIDANHGDLSIEVIVVDSASSDDSVHMVKREFPWVKVAASQQNLGYAGVNNLGAREATGRCLLILNPDTEIQGDSLRRMLAFMDANPDVGALGPQLLNPDRSVQPSCREFPRFSTLIWEFSGLSRLFPGSRIFGRWRMGYFPFDQPREVDQPMGSCLILRKQALEEVGIFDETFSMFFNDVDLCYRIKNAGWMIYFYPEARVVHHKGASTGKVKRKMIWLSHTAFFKFFKKHKTGLGNRLLLVLLSLPLFLLALPRMIVKR